MAHTVLVASNNAHKLEELREIFDLAGVGEDIRLVTPKDPGIALDPDETSDTYAGNALIKARAFAQAVRDLRDPGLRHLFVMADDSGLEVDALGGRPGVHSSRYHRAAPNGDGCAALLDEIQYVPDDKRTARFRCVIALIAPDDSEQCFEGVCEGRIGRETRGANGFGFDPVFVVSDDMRTMAELSSIEKHRISHRGIAARKVATYLLTQP
jgi:XTP/dITP diphosphohydrolase